MEGKTKMKHESRSTSIKDDGESVCEQIPCNDGTDIS